MLTNAQMISNRFGRWARARRMVNAIRSHLAAGHTVMLYTHLKATKFSKPEHAEMFKAARDGAYVQRGTCWDCIDYCGVKIFA